MKALPGELVAMPQADGTVKLDSRKLQGSTPEIMAELEELARECGAELVVEKHVGGQHTHTHGGTTIRHSH